jgi:DNA-binding CsgD family transcriptional regulator
LQGCVSEPEVWQTAARSACDDLGFERAAALRCKGTRAVVDGVHNRLAPGTCSAQSGRELPIAACALSQEMIQFGHATLVVDARADPRVTLPHLGKAAPRSFVAAPILSSGETLGFLCADYQSHCAINLGDRDRLACFAVAVGSALDRVTAEARLRDISQHARALAGLASAHRSPAFRRSSAADDQEPQPSLTECESLLARLTRREHHTLRLMALGRTNQQIADELGISRETAKSHVARVNRKLEAANRTEAAAVYQRLHAW